MIDIKELRSKSLKEVNKVINDSKKSLEKYVNDLYKGKEKNIVKTRFFRRDLARIQTVLNEKKFLEGEKNAKKNN